MPFDLNTKGQELVKNILNREVEDFVIDVKNPEEGIYTNQLILRLEDTNNRDLQELIVGNRSSGARSQYIVNKINEAVMQNHWIIMSGKMPMFKEITDTFTNQVNLYKKDGEQPLLLKDLVTEYPELRTVLNYVFKDINTKWKQEGVVPSKKDSKESNQPNPAESSQTTNEATERDPEVPSNETSINENEESQVKISKEDDSLQAGIEKDEPVKLGSILTAAWKSVRNFFNNTPGIDPITSNYLENPDTGNITQQNKDIVWEIDFNYIELREGGQYPRGTVNKLKNKTDLTDEELKVVPIKGTLLTKEGTTLTFYMHEEPYIFTNMDPKKWKQAIEGVKYF